MNLRLKTIAFAASLIPLTGWLVRASSAQERCAPVAAHTGTLSGEALFHQKGCEHCHAANFAGVTDKGPSLLTVGRQLKKDAIMKQIHDGGQEMPSFADALQPDEISALAEMLAKKKKAPKGVQAVKP